MCARIGIELDAAPREDRPVLRFRDDGTFKIIQIADMHYTSGKFSGCDVSCKSFDYCFRWFLAHTIYWFDRT